MLVQPPPGPLSGPSPARNRRRNPLWRFRRILFVLAVVATVTVGGVWVFASRVELTEDNFDELIETSYICTAEVARDCGPGNAINELVGEGQDRVIVDYADIPDVLIEAVVATEDQDYFTHRGIDPGGLLRAAYQTARREVTDGSGSLQGGSTITQQYIKLATEDDADQITRKAREIVRAIKLEQELTEELGSTEAAKQQVLERYLNRAYFGRGAYGVQAASRVYFDKDVDQLQLPEAAYLAGLLRSPNTADASEDRVEAERRRTVTLGLMAEQGYISLDQQMAADADPWPDLQPPPALELGLGEVQGSEYGTEYFVSSVRRQLNQLFPERQHFREGYRVYTTLDRDLQQRAYRTITSKLDPNNPDMPLGSLVSVDDDGRVVAMMGGASWDESQVNLATGLAGGGSGFQAGSQMKVFALAEFIEQGFSTDSYYQAPTRIVYPQDAEGLCARWPVGGGGAGNGTTRENHRTVANSTWWSRNTVYAQIATDIGADKMVETARRLGIESEMLECPSTVLGTNTVSPVEMAASFANVARQGLRLDPVMIERIEDKDGNVLCWYPTDTCTEVGSPIRTGEQVIDDSVMRQVIGIMDDVVIRGTGQAAQLELADGTVRPAAGKTGTTNDNRDAWFTGFTCGMTTAVWVGYPGVAGETPRFMNDGTNIEFENGLPTMAEIFGTEDYGTEITGGKIPAELWHDFMLPVVSQPGFTPCEELPTEGPSDGQRVLGLEYLTTLLHCAEPDPSLIESTTTTTDPNDTTSSTDESTTTSEGETTTTTAPEPDETTTTTEGGEQTTSTADPGNGGDDENALGLDAAAAGGVLRISFGAAQQQTTTTAPPPTQAETTVPQTLPPTTEPCIPIGVDGEPLETTIPPPSQPPSGGDDG